MKRLVVLTADEDGPVGTHPQEQVLLVAILVIQNSEPAILLRVVGGGQAERSSVP
jgi:hypothetical protein